MNKTDIEYLDYTWNPTVGCSPVSSGCRSCWAKVMAKRLKAMGSKDYQLDDPFKPRFLPHKLNEPMKEKKPSRIGVGFMGDLFHEAIDFEVMADEVLQIIVKTNHTYLMLTKRPDIMAAYFRWYIQNNILLPDNLWIGVSIEDQKSADKQILILLQIPAAVKWVSYEPALEYVDFAGDDGGHYFFPFENELGTITPGIDWIVMGAETGHKARPFNIEWGKETRDQCKQSGVPFFFKSAGKQAIPLDLQVREYPKWHI